MEVGTRYPPRYFKINLNAPKQRSEWAKGEILNKWMNRINNPGKSQNTIRELNDKFYNQQEA